MRQGRPDHHGDEVDNSAGGRRRTSAAHPHAGQTRSVSGVLPVDPAAAYLLVSDVVANAKHSAETVELAWLARAHPGRVSAGDRFTARNTLGGIDWTSTSVVTQAEPGQSFAFAVSGTEHPTATWTFTLQPAAGGSTRVTYQVVLGDGPSMFDTFSGPDPAKRQTAVTSRLNHLADDMGELLQVLARDAAPGSPR